MMERRYQSPDAFLAAYHASRDERPPAPDAFHWLRFLVQRGFNVGDSSYDYAKTLLDRAVIDVDDVVENFLGLNLFLNDLSEYDRIADAPVFGHAEPLAGAINICFRAEAYRPLYRATVMHEVAHMMLHASVGARPLQYAPTSKQRPTIEREADRFMAATLLPKPILYLAILLAGNSHGATMREALQLANTQRGRWQWRYIYFPFFLDRLCLSRELVAVRMVNGGIFSQETFEYHKTYPIPNRWRRPSPLSMGPLAEAAFRSRVA